MARNFAGAVNSFVKLEENSSIRGRIREVSIAAQHDNVGPRDSLCGCHISGSHDEKIVADIILSIHIINFWISFRREDQRVRP